MNIQSIVHITGLNRINMDPQITLDFRIKNLIDNGYDRIIRNIKLMLLFYRKNIPENKIHLVELVDQITEYFDSVDNHSNNAFNSYLLMSYINEIRLYLISQQNQDYYNLIMLISDFLAEELLNYDFKVPNFSDRKKYSMFELFLEQALSNFELQAYLKTDLPCANSV